MDIRTVKRVQNGFSLFLWGACFFYLLHSFTTECATKVDFEPIYRDAIKAVDPLEYFKEGDTHRDFATF